jgi:L-asparaginase
VSNATAAKIVTRVTDGLTIENAFDRTFEELKEIDGFAGAIGIDSEGNIFHQDSYPTMVLRVLTGWIFEVFE